MAKKGAPGKGRRYWAEAIEAWGKSGESVSSFCRRRKISETGFYRWRKRINAEAGMVPDVEVDEAPAEGGGFALVRLKTSGGEEADWSAVRALESESAIEIILAGGRAIRVRSGFNSSALALVLEILENRAC